MGSYRGWIATTNLLREAHVHANQRNQVIAHAILKNAGLVPRLSKPVSHLGGNQNAVPVPRVWFRASEARPHVAQIVEEIKKVSKNPGNVGVARRIKASNGHDHEAAKELTKQAHNRARWRRNSKARQDRIKAAKEARTAKPVATALPRRADASGVLIAVQFKTRDTLLFTMEEAREVYERLAEIFRS